jgi:hypothetical protein
MGTQDLTVNTLHTDLSLSYLKANSFCLVLPTRTKSSEVALKLPRGGRGYSCIK